MYVAKGGYFYDLRYFWHTWPREQTLVLESMAVWARPRESYDALAQALRLNFKIKLVPNTRMRPIRQDHPQCPAARVDAMKRLVSTCDLKLPFRCAWFSANALLATLLNARWPAAWNDGVDAAACARHGFTAADLRARWPANASS